MISVALLQGDSLAFELYSILVSKISIINFSIFTEPFTFLILNLTHYPETQTKINPRKIKHNSKGQKKPTQKQKQSTGLRIGFTKALVIERGLQNE